jgi:hypothetical protein
VLFNPATRSDMATAASVCCDTLAAHDCNRSCARSNPAHVTVRPPHATQFTM